jgi:flagellar biosynthesis protein FlhB
MDGVTVIFMSTVINRVTEQFKRAFLDQTELKDETKGALILFTSLLLGVLTVVLMFPATNLFVGLGSAPLAELIATGIVIGGLANGIDFLAKKLEPTVTTSSKSTLTVVGTEEKTALPPAV